MTDDTTPPAQLHRVDIGNNPPLVSLYALGGLGLVIGNLIVFFVPASTGNSSDATGNLIWSVLGNGLVTGGLMFLTGALVAHAINWQIGRSGARR